MAKIICLRGSFVFCACICVLLVSLATAQGQTTITGAIHGEVLDQGTNGPLGGALVTVVNEETGVPRTTLTDDSGRYYLSALLPGRYTVSCRKEGYDTQNEGGVPIEITRAAQIGVPPFSLRKETRPAGEQTPTNLGEEGEDVRAVTLTNATRGGGFDKLALQSLPLSGVRTFDSLALFLPGIAPPPQTIGSAVGPGVGIGIGTAGQFSANGLWSRGNNFTIDGSDNNDEDVNVRRQGYVSLTPQTIESVENFQVASLLPEPQYGRNFGAQVNVVSRSGSSGFHGDVYGFINDSSLNARDFFEYRTSGAQEDIAGRDVPAVEGGKNAFTRGQYGFSVAGPLSKSKSLFFTGAYEHQDINANETAHFAVPAAADRGLFGKGVEGLVVNGIPSRPTTDVGDAFFSLYPFPNNPGGPYTANTYTEVLPASGDGDVGSFRIDKHFQGDGSSHNLFARYNFTSDDRILPVTGKALFSSLKPETDTQNVSFALISTLSANTFNEARFSYGRTNLTFSSPGTHPYLRPTARPLSPTDEPDRDFLLNASLIRNETIPGQVKFTQANPIIESETLSGFLGQVFVSGFSPVGVDVFTFPQDRETNTIQFADTLRMRRGSHNLSFGFDTRRNNLDTLINQNSRPLAAFRAAPDLNSDSISSNGSDTPGYLLGRDLMSVGAATGFFQTQVANDRSTRLNQRFWQMNFFFQDQIRVRSNLILLAGFRYEFNTVPADEDLESALTNENIDAFITAENTRNGGAAQSNVFDNLFGDRGQIFDSDKNNFGPHLALAWDPSGDGRTSIRAGYGVYYNIVPGLVVSRSRIDFGDTLIINCPGFRGGRTSLLFTNPAGLAATGTLNRATGVRVTDPTTFIGNIERSSTFNGSAAQAGGGSSGGGFILPEKGLETPVAQHWTLDIEREFGSDLSLSVAYVGTRASHLLRVNTPNYGANSIPDVSSFSSTLLLTGGQIQPGPIESGAPRTGRLSPLAGSIVLFSSDGNSDYHAFQTSLRKRLARGLQFTTAYTWSHAIDETSDIFDLLGSTALPQDINNRRAERGNSSFDLRHNFTYTFVWDIPVARENSVLGGWQLSSLGRFSTGQPYTLYSGIDTNLDGNTTDRLNSTAALAEVSEGRDRLTVPSSFSDRTRLLPSNGRPGSVGRNTFFGAGIANMDISVNKKFKLSETAGVQFRAELYNLFNHAQFALPVNELFFPAVGSAVATQVPSRRVQFGLKLMF